MTIGGFLLLLLVAALCGGAGQMLGGYSAGGCLVSIVLGFVGAFVGLWLAGALGLPTILSVNIQGEPFPIVWSVIGAAIVSLVFGLISRPARRV
tara:strand:+ start:2519 stop:2800 length:282 start_codon:yes stop_codon:yes gene_type:complete